MSRPVAVTSVMDLYDRIRAGYWFLPGLFLIGGIVLSQLMLLLDRSFSPDVVTSIPGIGIGSMESARLILSTLAGSLITITALVFSLTIVALTLASSQFGPRLLRGFMRDRATQTSLGIFTGTFIYCLLVLYGAESPGHGGRLPHLGVAMAITLGILSMIMLIYFIHNVSTSIHVNEVLADVSKEFREQIDRLFPAPDADDEPESAQRASGDEAVFSGKPCGALRSHTDGYLRIVDESKLVEIARGADLQLELRVSPGDFVLEGLPLAFGFGPGELGDSLERELLGAFSIGSRRTSVQDIEFNIDQLVEMALRALSPGINDPRTAIACVHRLGQNLALLARRPFPPRERYDSEGQFRLLRRPLVFPELMERAFGRVLDASSGDLGVAEAVSGICGQMVELAVAPQRRESIENFIRSRLDRSAPLE